MAGVIDRLISFPYILTKFPRLLKVRPAAEYQLYSRVCLNAHVSFTVPMLGEKRRAIMHTCMFWLTDLHWQSINSLKQPRKIHTSPVTTSS